MSIFEVDFQGRSKHDIAVERIKTFCTGRKVLCAFSGGKDSQVCYHLLEEAGIPFDAQYSVTRFEPPELVDFLRAEYTNVSWRRAYRRSLVAEIETRGLPSILRRWCCDAKHTKTKGYDIAVIGVRAAESPRRKSNWRMFGYKPDHTCYLCPIIDWTDGEVWEYHSIRRLPHCSLYDQGFKRIGCVCCPLSPGTMRAQAERWPKTAAMLKQGMARHLKHVRGTEANQAEIDANFEKWLDCGFYYSSGKQASDLQCVFEGSGFSEKDGFDE